MLTEGLLFIEKAIIPYQKNIKYARGTGVFSKRGNYV